MQWLQRQLQLAQYPPGIHLITHEVVSQLPELGRFQVGLAHLFLQHTSAALTLNENAEPEVRADLHQFLDRVVPENAPYYTHRYEGPDDMPAHIKTVLVGSSVTIPVTAGRLAFGTWQGLYLCEFRRHAAARRLIVTVWGDATLRPTEE